MVPGRRPAADAAVLPRPDRRRAGRGPGHPLRALRARLADIRDAIADDAAASSCGGPLTALTRAGWELGGDRLKTSPREYEADHPRIDLLRHRSMVVSRSYGFESVIHGPELLHRVREDWRALRPFVRWVSDCG